MHALLILSLLGSGGWVDDRGCGFFGGTLTADTCMEDDIELRFGACADGAYWHYYDLTGTAYRFTSTDVDGGGTDGDIWYVDTGTQILEVVGGLNVTANVGLDSTGTNTNSPILELAGDNGGVEVAASMFLAYGAQPYLVFLVDDDGTTPVATEVAHLDDDSLRPASAAGIDLGSATAYFGDVIAAELSCMDSNASNQLSIDWIENDTADRALNISVNSGDRSVSLSGDLTVEATSTVNQDLTTDATGVQFADLELTTGPATVTSDANGICLGAVGTACTDHKQYFDGTDSRYHSPGSHRMDAPLIAGTYSAEANSFNTLVNVNCTSALSAGDDCGYRFAVDHSPDAYLDIVAKSDGADGVDSFELRVPTYNVDYVVTGGNAVLGPTAPTFTCNGACCGLTFDADAESVDIYFEIPDCYSDGASDDLTLKIYWCAEDGQNPAQNETVKFDIAVVTLDFGTDDVNGASTAGTVTYTEDENPGDENESHISTITIDADDGTNPINAGETLVIAFDRDFTGDTYGSDAIVPFFEIVVPQDQMLCDHQN